MSTPTVCSRCKGDNDTDQAYCRSCKSVYNKAYREKNLAALRERELAIVYLEDAKSSVEV